MRAGVCYGRPVYIIVSSDVPLERLAPGVIIQTRHGDLPECTAWTRIDGDREDELSDLEQLLAGA